MSLAARARTLVVGGQEAYLPNDVPTPGRLVVLGFQHVITMFPATVLVALLVGFDVGAVITMSGIATIVSLSLSRLITGKFIPLYYGSSFSYIAPTLAVTGAVYGKYAGDDLVSLAQVGIVATGAVNIVVGFAIRLSGGKKTLDTFLPPVVTGSVASVIGIALSFSALDMASANWGLALGTLLLTILLSVYLAGRGFLGLIPILLAALIAYTGSVLAGNVDFTSVEQTSLFAVPHFTLPAFGNSDAWSSIATIAVIAIATIPESTAHLYQIGLYVDTTAEKTGRSKYHLSDLIGINLVLDGIGDAINGFLGGVAGTNYGENNSLMVITRNYSGPALLAAGLIATILGFVGKLTALILTIPVALTGGLAIYLFGVIGAQGIALMIAEKVDFYLPRNLAIAAVIHVIGIGGHIGFPNSNLPIHILPEIFPNGLPAIATAAVMGILLNAVFQVFPPSRGHEAG